jgi:hypothetical protein
MRPVVLAPVFALLLASPPARGLSLDFHGDEPQFPHVWLQLEAAQRDALDRAAPGGPVVLALTPAQQLALRADAGAGAPWLFVLDRAAAARGCTPGGYNLAVRAGPWLAVAAGRLGDFPAPDEVLHATRGLADPALAAGAPAVEPEIRATEPGTPPPVVERARELLPGGRFARYLPVGGGWQAVSVRRAPLPERVEDLADAALGITAERQLEVHPTGASSAAWPTSGARWLAPDGTALYAIPHVLEGEGGPPARAWLLLAYRDGLLVEHALLAESGLVAGATYAWEE